ncbi:hypothetical protein ACOMHN_025392 [Nucella lapillus]
MFAVQVYLSWANSVLSEANSSVENVSGVQDGKVLCQIIDILLPEAGLISKIQASGVTTQRAYIQMALEHMKTHGVKLTFAAQDIIDGDIKSLLDVMWLLILNYGIHFIGERGSQRGVGTGKRVLMDWCQGELDLTLDPKNTLTYSLCSENRFVQLLQKFAGRQVDDIGHKVSHVSKLLQEMEERYGIKSSIINPTDVTDGTVDDHTLMIYLSLLRRRVCNTARHREMFSVEGKDVALEKERIRSVSEEPPNRRRHSELVTLTQQLQQQQQQQQQPQRSSRSASMDSSSLLPPVGRTTTSSTGRGRSPGERSNFLLSEAEQVLRQTISDKVKEHVPTSDRDEDKDTDASGRETESLSEFSSGALDEGYITNRIETPRTPPAARKENGRVETVIKRQIDKQTDRGSSKKSEDSKVLGGGERGVKIRIKRPKDYYLQWEETIDRLSQGSPDPPDVSGMSPRSPIQILRGIEEVHTPRSASSESDVYGGHYAARAWRRKDYSDRRVFQGKTGRRRGSPSPGSADRSRKRISGETHLKQTEGSRRESRRNDQEHHEQSISIENASRNGHQEISWPEIGGNSTFMERLEELKRSGRAQRVILPDLGPDAPVLMIPGQGEEVLLLFDALRQARLDVNLNMGKATGDTGRVTQTSVEATSRDASSPTQTEDSTELKRTVKTDKDGTRTSEKSSTAEKPKSSSGRIPRPTVHRHHFSKPIEIRHLANFQSSKDGRRTKSFSERSAADVNTTSASSRYRSLSPPRKYSPYGSDRLGYTTRVQPERSSMTFRDVSTGRTGVVLSPPGRRNLSRDSTHSLHRSYRSSPVMFSESAPTSPFRRPVSQTTYRSPSPLNLSSSRNSPERLPPLELPADLASPRPWIGGLSRVPRREAWERQKQKKEPPATDSSAQAKFIEVLCKEIEELKQKIEVMEESQTESSPERASPTLRRPTTPTGQTGTFYTSRSEIQETDSKMLLAPRGDSPSVIIQRAGQSPKPWESPQSAFSPSRASPNLRSEHSSVSPKRQYTTASPTTDRSCDRQSPSPDRTHTDLSPKRRTAGETSPTMSRSRLSMERSSEPSQARDLRSPVRQESPGRSERGGISLGYKSPIRSVTQEIWGKDLKTVEGLDPNRKDNYKRLIAQSSLTEEEVIELKQSLASAVVENDILQAKLNNARIEIQDKLGKTNEVLDDCRRHLARSQAENMELRTALKRKKESRDQGSLNDCRRHLARSQAENMELRTALEREKDRAETSEARVRDLQQIVQQVRSDNDELEQELDRTLSILDRSKPGIDALKQQNAQLQGRASVMQDDNSTLKREMDDLRKSHFRSVNTIRELRNLLDEVRQERSELQQKVSSLERSQSESKVQSIIMHYSQQEEKGAKDETENELSSSGVSSCSERSRSGASSHFALPGSRGEDMTSRMTSPGKAPVASGSGSGGGSLATASPGQSLDYSYGDLSPPTVPSTYREIYPHRKPRYQTLSGEKYGNPDLQDSPGSFMDYPDLEHCPTKLDQLDLSEDYPPEDDYRTSSGSPDPSPTLKPTPYRSYLQDNKSSFSESFLDRSPEDKSPLRGRSLSRTSREFRGSRSSSTSPVRGLSSDLLNRSFDAAMFDRIKMRSTSSSPGRYQDSLKGILKKARDRSCSPRYYGIRTHSPPTRLSPEDKKAAGRKRMFTRTQAGEIAREFQRELDKEDLILDGIRNKHSTKSWFELQLEEADCSSDTQLPDVVGEEHLLLSEEQRNYANELIKKYTGLKL